MTLWLYSPDPQSYSDMQISLLQEQRTEVNGVLINLPYNRDGVEIIKERHLTKLTDKYRGIRYFDPCIFYIKLF